MNMRRQLLAAATAAASAAGLGMPSVVRAQSPYKSEYRLSLVVGPGTAWYQGAESFANRVRERTAGRINMKLYPGSSIVQGAQDRELAALRQGAIDALVGTTVNWSGTVKDFAVFSLPFLLSSAKAVDAVLASEALNKDFYDIVRKAGMEPLASAEYGYIQLLNSKRRLARPGDIAGLKIRTVATPLQRDVMTELGANPTTMSWADAQSAMSTGAIDGLTLTLEQALAYKVHSLGQKHITLWNAYNELLHFGIANPVWKSWTPDDQAIVRAVAQEVAREVTQVVRKSYDSEGAFRQLGVEVYKPTPAEFTEWQIKVRRPYAKWKAQINHALATRIEEVVERALKV